MELKDFYKKGAIEVGCDEAGRGCLAGPVFAAAVILNPKKRIKELDDSKQLSKSKRDELRSLIEDKALAWAVASVSPQEIDEINILNASFLAMHRAVEQLTVYFDHLLIDGNRFNPFKAVPHFCIVKGDAKFKSIAAASILAKTHRDECMQKLGVEYPNYNWQNNQGYPTAKHRMAIQEFGACVHHRLSFNLLTRQLKLF